MISQTLGLRFKERPASQAHPQNAKAPNPFQEFPTLERVVSVRSVHRGSN
jgi:hypothetical protein